MRGDSETREHEQKILDAIMNDQSRSSASSPISVKNSILESEVTCIGRKPPMTNADSRPSKTPYVRTTLLFFIIALSTYLSYGLTLFS